LTSWEVGRSEVIDFGLIETRVFRNAALSAKASGYRCAVSIFYGRNDN